MLSLHWEDVSSVNGTKEGRLKAFCLLSTVLSALGYSWRLSCRIHDSSDTSRNQVLLWSQPTFSCPLSHQRGCCKTSISHNLKCHCGLQLWKCRFLVTSGLATTLDLLLQACFPPVTGVSQINWCHASFECLLLKAPQLKEGLGRQICLPGRLSATQGAVRLCIPSLFLVRELTVSALPMVAFPGLQVFSWEA